MQVSCHLLGLGWHSWSGWHFLHPDQLVLFVGACWHVCLPGCKSTSWPVTDLSSSIWPCCHFQLASFRWKKPINITLQVTSSNPHGFLKWETKFHFALKTVTCLRKASLPLLALISIFTAQQRRGSNYTSSQKLWPSMDFVPIKLLV